MAIIRLLIKLEIKFIKCDLIIVSLNYLFNHRVAEIHFHNRTKVYIIYFYNLFPPPPLPHHFIIN